MKVSVGVGSSGVFAAISRFTFNRYAIELIDGALASGSLDWASGRTSILILAASAAIALVLARVFFRVDGRSGGCRGESELAIFERN